HKPLAPALRSRRGILHSSSPAPATRDGVERLPLTLHSEPRLASGQRSLQPGEFCKILPAWQTDFHVREKRCCRGYVSVQSRRAVTLPDHQFCRARAFWALALDRGRNPVVHSEALFAGLSHRGTGGTCVYVIVL